MRRGSSPRISVARFFRRDSLDYLSRPRFFLDRDLCCLLCCAVAKPQEQPAVSDRARLRTSLTRSLDRRPYYGVSAGGIVTGVQCEYCGIVTVRAPLGKAK